MRGHPQAHPACQGQASALADATGDHNLVKAAPLPNSANTTSAAQGLWCDLDGTQMPTSKSPTGAADLRGQTTE